MRLGRTNLLLGAALAAVLALAMTVTWVSVGGGDSEAAGTPPTMTLDATGTGVSCSGAAPNRKCTVNPPGTFAVLVRADSGGQAVGSFGTEVAFQTGLTYTPKACLAEVDIAPEGFCLGPTVTNPSFGTTVAHGGGTSQLVDIPRPAATSLDPVLTMPNVTCVAGTYQIVLTLISTDRPLGAVLNENMEDLAIDVKGFGSKVIDVTDDFTTNPVSVAYADVLTINCGAAMPPTATPTSTTAEGPTATATTTATATNTTVAGATATPTNTVVTGPTNTPTNTVIVPPTATRTPTVPGEKLLGDVDADGDVDSIDALWVLWVDARLADESDLVNADSADVNGDGVIDSIDALFILWIQADLYQP